MEVVTELSQSGVEDFSRAVLYRTSLWGWGAKLRFQPFSGSLVTDWKASFSPLPNKHIVRRAVDAVEQAYDQIGRACGHRTAGEALVGPTPLSSSPWMTEVYTTG